MASRQRRILDPVSIKEYGNIGTYDEFVKWHRARISGLTHSQWNQRLEKAWQKYLVRRNEAENYLINFSPTHPGADSKPNMEVSSKVESKPEIQEPPMIKSTSFHIDTFCKKSD